MERERERGERERERERERYFQKHYFTGHIPSQKIDRNFIEKLSVALTIYIVT